MKIINYLFLSITLLIFTGCAFSTGPESVKQVKTIHIDKTNDYTDLEKQIIEIAKENERMYNEYIEILNSVKNNMKMYDKTKIPKGLARRMTFHYEGPALILLKNIAAETGYSFDYNKYRSYDTKNIVRNYTDTMLIDIIYDIASTFNFDVKIDETNNVISLQER